MKYLTRFTFSTLLLTLTLGCGYQMAGKTHLPPDLETIAIPIFRNHTSEPILEDAVTSAIKREFLTNSRLGVVNNPKTADLALKGTISSYGLTPLSFDRLRSIVLEYRIHIRAEITIEDVRTHKILWKDISLEATAEYPVTSDPAATRVAQNRANEEASRALAENLVSRVLEGF